MLKVNKTQPVKTNPSYQTGFTIIEVLIVLAIAGLILLIVFLAVPALQRNSRNTQRRKDVSMVIGAIQEFYGNNNATLPADATATQCNTAGTDCNKVLELANMGIYTENNRIRIATATGDVTNNMTTANSGLSQNVYILKNAKCNSGDATITGATTKSIAVLYAIEESAGDVKQCTAS